MDINKCTPHKEGTHSLFVSREHGCEHRGKNDNCHRIRQYKVDGEVFPETFSEEKCDYLLLNDTDKRAYYIELKGSDFSKAIRQIENSIRLLHESISDYTIYRRIVYRSGTHGIRRSEEEKWKLKYSNADSRSRIYPESIS